MAALTAARAPDRLGEEIRVYEHPIAGNTKIWQGALCMLNASGLLVSGAAATGQLCAGLVAEKTYDNTGGAASAFQVPVQEGCFLFANSTAGDAIAQADVGKQAYIADDQTVAKTDGGGTRSKAGIIRKVTASGVFVHVGLMYLR